MILTPEETRQMTAEAQQQDTPALCKALMAFHLPRSREDDPGLDVVQRQTRRVLIDVLTARHPEADAAFTRWATDEATYMACTAEEAITRAALAAAGIEQPYPNATVVAQTDTCRVVIEEPRYGPFPADRRDGGYYAVCRRCSYTTYTTPDAGEAQKWAEAHDGQHPAR